MLLKATSKKNKNSSRQLFNIESIDSCYARDFPPLYQGKILSLSFQYNCDRNLLHFHFFVLISFNKNRRQQTSFSHDPVVKGAY